MDNGGSPRDALGKLLPKTLSVKRQRRKDKKATASNDSNSSLGVDDDDDARSARGRSKSPAASARGSSSSLGARSKRSLGSLDSLQKARQKKTSREKLSVREDSREEEVVVMMNGGDGDQQSSPVARPATISAHPSLIGYLTTSSPVVQAEHLDSQHDIPDALAPALPSKTSNDDIPAALPLEPPIITPPSAAKVASPSRRAKPTIEVETRPPRTPPTAETASHAPAIVNTPPTPVEAQTARAFASDWKAPWRGSSPPPSSDGSPPSRNMSAHRRARSGSVNHGPSKLSTITSAPLSPPVESVESTASGPSNASTGGFFSSMFSAAQNAANNISSNIQNSGISIGPNKSKHSTPSKPQNLNTPSRTSIAPSVDTTPKAEPAMEKKESSLRSIGSGDLSLSHLGLPDLNSGEASAASTKFPELSDQRARSESAPVDISQAPSIDLSREGSGSRPRSLIEPVAGAGEDLPTYDQVDNKLGLHRNSSLRSASKKHRKRGSSVATAGTGTTIGAAIAAANSSLANPTAAAPAPKLTGFAIASKKRNRDFHSIFKSVPDDDYLIEDYSCALQREILAHGRLYVSEGHLCFSSNILGWTTTLVMSFDEIVSVEKRSTALVFKNGLMISTLHAKHIFASFTSRDATYDLIVNIWKLGHPTLTSTLNGVRLEGTGGDKTERPDNESPNAGNESQLESDSAEDSAGEDSEYYDSDENEDASDNPQLADSTVVNGEPEKSVVARKASATSPTGSSPAIQGKESPVASTGEADFPGPSTHAPTDCGDSASHYDRVVGDEVIAAPLGKVYNLLFGPPSGNFMSKWLANDQKCTDVQMDDKKGLIPGNTSRTYSYIKPLGGSIGPKQTKCIVTETLENLDLEKSANFNVSTQTPDVPSGNVFVTKTRYCLSWAENNSTRLQMNCTVEWSGKSWLKGPIEKGANDGQAQFCRDICAALRAAVSSKTKAGALGNTAGRTKRKGKRGKTAQPSGDAAEPQQKHAAKQDWGALEPLRQLLEPVLDIVQPVLTGNVMYGLLVGLLVATWFGFGFPPSRESPNYAPHPHMGAYFPDRLAAYEEMWRREDSELWDWLEERVGIGRLSPTDVRGSPSGSSSASAAGLNTRKKRPVEPRTLEERLREEKMDGRQVEEAIRVTEEKLEVLREAMQRVHLANGNKSPKQKPISKEAA